MPVITKCDLIRGAVEAVKSNKCDSTNINQPSLCRIPDMANRRMKVFAEKITPAFNSDAIILKKGKIKNNENAINESEQILLSDYPGASADTVKIGWPDFEHCRGGDGKYYTRSDIQNLDPKNVNNNFNPIYPWGKALAIGTVWKPPASSPLSVYGDYVSNPDLIVIVVFVFLVMLLGILVLIGQKKSKRREYLDDLKLVGAVDPPTKQSKLRDWIVEKEKAGYNMNETREKYGYPIRA